MKQKIKSRKNISILGIGIVFVILIGIIIFPIYNIKYLEVGNSNDEFVNIRINNLNAEFDYLLVTSRNSSIIIEQSTRVIFITKNIDQTIYLIQLSNNQLIDYLEYKS